MYKRGSECFDCTRLEHCAYLGRGDPVDVIMLIAKKVALVYVRV